MAARRRRRKRALRRRKRTRRNIRRLLRTGSSAGKFHFTRQCLGTTIGGIAQPLVAQTNADQVAYVTMALAALPNVTEFTNLFSHYRIDKVVYKLIPNNQIGTIDADIGALVSYGIHGTVVDPSGQTYANLLAFMQNSRFRIRQINSMKPVTIVVRRPPFLDTIGGPGTRLVRGWLETTNPNTVHNCFSWYISAYNTATAAQSWIITAKVFITCKGVI